MYKLELRLVENEMCPKCYESLYCTFMNSVLGCSACQFWKAWFLSCYHFNLWNSLLYLSLLLMLFKQFKCNFQCLKYEFSVAICSWLSFCELKSCVQQHTVSGLCLIKWKVHYIFFHPVQRHQWNLLCAKVFEVCWVMFGWFALPVSVYIFVLFFLLWPCLWTWNVLRNSFLLWAVCVQIHSSWFHGST